MYISVSLCSLILFILFQSLHLSLECLYILRWIAYSYTHCGVLIFLFSFRTVRCNSCIHWNFFLSILFSLLRECLSSSYFSSSFSLYSIPFLHTKHTWPNVYRRTTVCIYVSKPKKPKHISWCVCSLKKCVF